MRQKTTLYALISLLLTAVIVCGGVWFNHRFPLLPENGSLSGMDLSHAVTLTGWTQTSPGQWRVQFTDAPADAEWVVCFPGRTRRVQPEALEPMERSEEFFRLPEGASEITVRAPSVPRAWLMPAGTAWRWLDLRSSLQLVTLAAFVSMGAGILALFCFKPQYELGYFLLYLGIMFGWGLSVYLHPLTTSTTHDVLQRFYFSFAVLVPIWLCSALTHGPRLTRKSRSFSAAAGLMVLFLALSVSSSRLLRNSTLTLGMLCVLVQLSAALARGQQSALYLLAGDILTTGLRGLVLLLPSCSGILTESFPLYMLRCARIYDLPFTLGCLVFVSRRYALQFDRTEQLAQELDLPVSVHDREAHAEMYELLRQYRPRGVLHCYSGSAEDAAWLTAQGMALGFGGAVTYKGAKRAAKVLAMVPHELAVLETDCPYMSPEPVRGTRNDSRNIAHVAARIGEIWQMDAQSVLDLTAENAKRIFNQ